MKQAQVSSSGRQGRVGFTLVEVLISAFILGILTLALVACMQVALTYWGKTNDQVLVEENVRTAMTVVSADLHQANYATDVVPPTGAVVTPNTAAGNKGPAPIPIPVPAAGPNAYATTLDFFEPIVGATGSNSGFVNPPGPGNVPARKFPTTFNTTSANFATNYQEVKYTLTTVALNNPNLPASANPNQLLRTVVGGNPTVVVTAAANNNIVDHRFDPLVFKTWVAGTNMVGIYFSSAQGSHFYELQTFVSVTTR